MKHSGNLLCGFGLLVALFWSLDSARAATWDGSSSGNWATAANWSGGLAPVAGDDLIFPAGVTRVVMSNTFPADTIFGAITFGGSNYMVSGNAFGLTDGIRSEQVTNVNQILAQVTLRAPQTFECTRADGSLRLSGNVDLGTNTLSTGGAGTVNFGSPIFGSSGVTVTKGGVTKIGLGTVSYTSPSGNFYTGTTFVRSGTLVLNTPDFLPAIRGPLIIGDPSDSQFQADIVRILSHDILEPITVTVIHPGRLELGPDSTTLIDTLHLNGGHVTTDEDRSALEVTNRLSGSSSMLGPGTISGVLNIGLGTREFDITDGPFTPDVSISGTVRGDVGLAADLLKTGAGELLLQNSTNYRGATTISQGTLSLSHSNALGTNGVTVNNGASLRLQNVTVANTVLTCSGHGVGSLGALQASGDSGWTRPITLAAITFAPDASIGADTGATLTLSGVVSGSADFTKIGLGTVVLAGSEANTYSGVTTVRSGVLELDKSSGFSVQGSQLIIGDDSGSGSDMVRLANNFEIRTTTDIRVNRTGILNLNGFTDDIGDISIIGGAVQTGAGTLQMVGTVTASGTTAGLSFQSARITGNLDLGRASRTFLVNDNPFANGAFVDLFVDAVIRGTNGVIKTGDGDLQLNAANTFTGAVTVNDGELIAADPLALGTSAGGVTVNNDATLTLFDALVLGESLTLNSTASNPGALFAMGTTNLWTGPIILSQTARIGVAASAGLNLNTVINGTGGLEKEGDGQLKLSGATGNTFSGTTFVKAGNLFCDKTGGVGSVPNDLIIGDGIGTDIDLVFFSFNQISDQGNVTLASSGRLAFGAETIGSLSGEGTVEVFNTGELRVGLNNASTAYDGVISGGGRLTKQGAGTLTLNGTNTYTGATTVEAGTLLVNGPQPASAVTVRAGASLGGVGAVGALSVATSGNVRPGTSPGRLGALSTVLSNNAVLHVELNGPVAGEDYDQLNVAGTVNLAGSILQRSLSFPPFEGQVFTIINNNAADAVVGTFDGLPNGGTLVLNNLQFRINYNGGSASNDVVLTAQNFPVQIARTTVTSGNLNGIIDANECNLLRIVLTNASAAVISGITAQLVPLTPGVIVTAGTSAYPNLPVAGTGTNLTFFQISTLPEFVCGANAEFELVITTASGVGPLTLRPVLPSGETGGSSTLFSSTEPLGIPDNSTAFSDLAVSGLTTPINKVVASLFLAHPNDADLDLFLVAPDGTRVELSTDNGGTGNSYGTTCNPPGATTFNDDAGLPIAQGVAPFAGTFRPEGRLADFRGMLPAEANGTWRLEIADDTAANTGALNCWSLRIFGSVCLLGGGPCESCPNRTIAATISASTPQQTRLLRQDRRPSICGDQKPCPGVFDPGTRIRFAKHAFVNGPDSECITVSINPGPCPLFSAAYLGNYDPVFACNNYLADPGAFALPGSSNSFTFKAGPHATFVVAVFSTNDLSLNCPYTLAVSGGSCQPKLGFGVIGGSGGAGFDVLAAPAAGEKLVLDWSTAALGWQLECIENLPASPIPVWTPITTEPVVLDSKLTVTVDVDGTNKFFRLRRP